jgi:YD repeat-containing protein
VRRYDVTNTSQYTTTSSKHNTAGAVVSTTDASTHTTQFSYADSFSDSVSRNTFAYVTTVTDPDGYTATAKYNFDFGAATYQRTPQPDTTQNLPGPEQTFTFDQFGRLQQVTSLVNGAYTRYEYPASNVRVDTYRTIEQGLGEAHSFKLTDGVGRVIATALDHPGSVGGYSGQRFVYNVMGLVAKTSNPTETNAVGAPSQWAAAGDDAASGWLFTEQSFDWKGRPLVTTNPDLTTKTASYAGCGCAGGQVVTLTDEGTLDGGVTKRRQQKIYSDVLGRTIKTEVLNWQGGSVYSTVVNTYNARDQITQLRQYAGAEGSGTYQDTTITYDGHGRPSTRHLPEQSAGTATTWTYNPDDTVNTVTDARGAVSALSYNARHLTTAVTHTLTGQPEVTASFSYDAVGNRTSMTDGAGSVTYIHNQLSQLTAETRSLTGIGNFTLNYTYTLSGQLSSITDPFGAQASYSHDRVGRLTAVNGANFGSVSSYASNLQYRAWGALKSLTYGNSRTLALGYDTNLNVSTYEIPGLIKKSYQYYDDGRLKFTQDQFITNSKFDRSYVYDHLGRATTALSGAEARGQAPTDDRPYNENMAYDPMGHLTLRELRHWDRYDTTSTQTYINNRRQGWQYDADGRLLSGDTFYSYNAAGQISSFGAGDPYATDQQLDGDGQRIKSVQRRYDLSTNQWTTEKVTYYIHSSVVGKLISEVTPQGAKERSFVYAGSQLMAIQHTVTAPFVTWEHYEPSNATYRATDTQGEGLAAAEMDPLGADAGFLKPLTWPESTAPGKLEPYYGVAQLNGAFSGCVLDGVPVPCDMLTNDNSQQCEGNQCGPVLMERRDKKTGKVINYELSKPFQAWGDGGYGYLPRDAVYTGRGRYSIPQLGELGAGRVQNAAQARGRAGEASDEECDRHRSILLGRDKAVLDAAWERSQAGTSAIHEEGGLLGWAIDHGESFQKNLRVDRRFPPLGAGPRGELGGFNRWADKQKRDDKDTVRFDYTYHTHPFEEGEIDPVDGREYGDPNRVSFNDYTTSRTTGLTGVIVTKNSIIVHDDGGRKLCTFAR